MSRLRTAAPRCRPVAGLRPECVGPPLRAGVPTRRGPTRSRLWSPPRESPGRPRSQRRAASRRRADRPPPGSSGRTAASSAPASSTRSRGAVPRAGPVPVLIPSSSPSGEWVALPHQDGSSGAVATSVATPDLARTGAATALGRHTGRVDPQGVTPREREVLLLLGEHLTHEQIGQRLFISVRTVESHVASLRRKLAMPDHRALVRHSVEQRRAPAIASPPAALISFIGRARELGQLRAALDTARLVSAVGPGGVGKTRLALAAVEGRDAQWVDLVPVTDSIGLEEAVAHACGALPSSRLGPVEATVAALRGRRVLLVLDNCEHLVNAVAVLVERLLTASPDLTVLVTSRVRLVLPFERVFRTDGLSVDVGGDAVALFVERAVAAGATPPAAGELARISQVCNALGGLALAIEMAAARLPSIGLDGVERGLLDQGTLLTGCLLYTSPSPRDGL